MAGTHRILVLSDVHFACAAEVARGPDHELHGISSRTKRLLLGFIRRHVWVGNPFAGRMLLRQFLANPPPAELVVGLGDYGCDPEYLGLSDPVVFTSVSECLDLLRGAFGSRFVPLLGDHELGKLNVTGERGRMSLRNWTIATEKLGIRSFWQLRLGSRVLIGFVSSLVALPNLKRDIDPAEAPEWDRLRREHLAQLRNAFAQLEPEQKVLLFCHDPTALGYLWEEEPVRARVGQIEHTFVGHLHSRLVLTKSRLLAGMPRIGFLGHSIRRYSEALNLARRWHPFKVRLCPAPFGMKLMRDGGFLMLEVPEAQDTPTTVRVLRTQIR